MRCQSFFTFSTLVQAAQSESTSKLYDVEAREALQNIVRERYFWEHTR